MFLVSLICGANVWLATAGHRYIGFCNTTVWPEWFQHRHTYWMYLFCAFTRIRTYYHNHPHRGHRKIVTSSRMKASNIWLCVLACLYNRLPTSYSVQTIWRQAKYSVACNGVADWFPWRVLSAWIEIFFTRIMWFVCSFFFFRSFPRMIWTETQAPGVIGTDPWPQNTSARGRLVRPSPNHTGADPEFALMSGVFISLQLHVWCTANVCRTGWLIRHAH